MTVRDLIILIADNYSPDSEVTFHDEISIHISGMSEGFEYPLRLTPEQIKENSGHKAKGPVVSMFRVRYCCLDCVDEDECTKDCNGKHYIKTS